MRTLLRSGGLLVVGMMLGSLLTTRSAAQQPRDPGIRLNSVGLSVKDFDAELDFYTKKLGFREAVMLRDDAGKPRMAFLQVNRDTFVQLVPATPTRPPGLSSVLFEVDDVQAIAAKLKQAGTNAGDVRPAESTVTKQPLTSLTDPEGIRLEFLQFTPGSLIRTAKDSWK